jgi:hypothetical protein
MIRGDNTHPAFHRYNPSAISDMWENCLQFDLTSSDKMKMYQIAHVGRNLEKDFGKNLKGKYLSSTERRIMPGSNLMEYVDKCVESGEYILSQGQFVNNENKIVKYRNCMMPFVNIKNEVKNIIVGLSWKAF